MLVTVPRTFLLTCLLLAATASDLRAATDPDGTGDPAGTLLRLGGAVEMGGSLAADGADTGFMNRRVRRAPVGVSGAELLAEDQWAFSIRVAAERLDGLRDGTSRVDEARGYLISPLDMDRNMLLLGAQYAPSDSLTLAVTLPWIENVMNQEVNLTGERFRVSSKGFGDALFSGLVRLYEGDTTRLHFSLGVSAPTGSITEEDDNPFTVGADTQLQFPMQLGTGTWDVLPALTFVSDHEQRSWGVQLGSRIHTGENSQGYTRGDRVEATAWVTHHFDESQSASLRVAISDWDETSNFDDDVPNTAPPAYRVGAVPNADPDIQGGQRYDLLLGWNSIAPPDSEYAGHRLAVEFGVPFRQALSGPALETDWVFTCGWQKAF